MRSKRHRCRKHRLTTGTGTGLVTLTVDTVNGGTRIETIGRVTNNADVTTTGLMAAVRAAVCGTVTEYAEGGTNGGSTG